MTLVGAVLSKCGDCPPCTDGEGNGKFILPFHGKISQP